MNNSFMEKLRDFLGIRPEPPRNDFRNPIWSSDDEDDEDELYSRQNTDMFTDPLELHQEFSRQMQEIFKSFGSMFGDVRLFQGDHLDEFSMITGAPSEEEPTSGNIRDYYLKPGYHNQKHEHPKRDIDLDGKISSQEISGLLNQKEDGQSSSVAPFNGNLVPGRSFCQTIITTSVKKPDGTIETKKIVKNGNEVVEEITTTSIPDVRGPYSSSLEQMGPMGDTGVIYNNVMSELSSLFRNFY